MQDQICPRCGVAFQCAARLAGLVCLPCMKAADEWQDLAPTRPRSLIPLTLPPLQPE